MRRAVLGFGAFFSACAIAWAASSFTPNLNLEKPARGDTNWDSAIRGNADILDDAIVHDGTQMPSGARAAFKDSFTIDLDDDEGTTPNSSTFTVRSGANGTALSVTEAGVLTLGTALGAGQGGTGLNSSASTGVPRVASGTWSVDAGISHLASSTSASLATVLSDETGSGAAVFGTAPTISSPTFTTKMNPPSVTAFPGSPVSGDVVIVTDDSAAGACDSAAGSAVSICRYNGSAWAAIGDGGGGGAGDITDVWSCTTGNCNALTAASGDSFDATAADSTAACKDGTATPASCAVGECFFDTDATAGRNLFLCTATNTWTEVAGTGGSPAGSNLQVQYNNAGAFGAEADFTYSPGSNHLEIFGESQITVDPTSSTDRGFITLQHGGTSGTGGGRVRWLTGWGVDWSMGTKNSDAKLYLGMNIVDPTTNARLIFGAASAGPVEIPDGVYLQASDNNAGAPAAGDCDADAERGRFSIDTTNNRLYVCNGATRGWDYVALTD